MKPIIQAGIVILMIGSLIMPANALLKKSGKKAPIAQGDNVIAGAAVNDAPGSSDLTLIIQLKIDGRIVVDEGHKCTAIQPKENIPSDKDPTGWTQPKFDDKDWRKGEYGIGYGDNDDNMRIGVGAYAMVYSRAIFKVRSIRPTSKVELGADFDDGCVIWINGVEVARESNTDIPDEPEWDSWTDKGSGHSHEASKTDPPQYEFVKLNVKVIGNPLAVEPADKLATSWGEIKAGY